MRERGQGSSKAGRNALETWILLFIYFHSDTQLYVHTFLTLFSGLNGLGRDVIDSFENELSKKKHTPIFDLIL